MGVAGAAGVLQKHGHLFGKWISLKDTKVVLDVTEAMHWFVKKHFMTISRVDLYGSNMVALCSFYRGFFKQLRERNVTPIIVYSGGRLFEQTHGQLAAKTAFLERSARFALNRVLNKRWRDLNSLPDLAVNALKEVINEFNFEHVYQAAYEVYPLLERLAEEHQCPVMTSHSDFMFANAGHGFIWMDRMELPPASSGPPDSTSPRPAIRCLLYKREDILNYFSGLKNGAGAVRSLYVLLRDDFAETHYEAVNRVLNLPMDLKLRPGPPDRKKTRRLLHVLNNWPSNLTTFEEVLRSLRNNPNRAVSLERDFRSINESFSQDRDLFDSQLSHLVRSFLPNELSLEDFQAACCRRESSLPFMMELKQMVNINRCQTVEDLRLLKSTWSLGDRLREYLIDRLQVDQLKLLDRRYSQLDQRLIRPMQQRADQSEFVLVQQQPRSPVGGRAPASPSSAGGGQTMTASKVFWLFHFNEKTLDQVASLVQQQHQLNADQSRSLALLLLKARFAHKLAFRENYDTNLGGSRQQQARAANLGRREEKSGKLADAASQSASLPSNTSSEAEPDTARNATSASVTGNYTTARARQIFYTALVNCFVFYSNEQQVGDSTRQDIPAEIRVARAKMEDLDRQSMPQGLGDTEYFQIKHQVEMLNSALHYYKEINSLFNFVAPSLLVNRCYNAALLYHLIRRWSNNLSEHLLRVDDRLMSILNE